METIKSERALKAAIHQLEITQANEGRMMKEQFHLAYESVKPVNLIKSTFHEVVASQDLKEKLINTSVGLAAGYLSKALFEGTSHSPIKKLLGTALLFGITNAVVKNPEAVKSVGRGLLDIVWAVAGSGQRRSK
jgi:hypothetical protein